MEPNTFGVNRLISALRLDDVVLGGGNAMKLQELPPGCRVGTNANALIGGFRMWEARKAKQAGWRRSSPRAKALRQNRIRSNTRPKEQPDESRSRRERY